MTTVAGTCPISAAPTSLAQASASSGPAPSIAVWTTAMSTEAPAERASAIVRATTHYRDAAVVAEVSRGLGDAMQGIETSKLSPSEMMQTRGW